jgi:hypothetical protein
MRNQTEIHPLQLLWHMIIGNSPQPFHILETKQAGVRKPSLDLGAHQQELAVGSLQGDSEEQIDIGAIPERTDIPQDGLGCAGQRINSLGQERSVDGLINANTRPQRRKLLFIRPGGDGDQIGNRTQAWVLFNGEGVVSIIVANQSEIVHDLQDPRRSRDRADLYINDWMGRK